MSKPIYDSKQQLSYIKAKLDLITHMVNHLDEKEIKESDFYNLELELRDLVKKTRLFQYRSEGNKEK